MAKKKEIQVVFNASVDKFGRNVDKANGDLKRFSSSANTHSVKIKKSFTGIGTALAGVVSIGALSVLTKNALDTADAIGKLSSVSGLSVKRVQEFRFAVDQTGGTLQQADAAILKFGKRVGLAKDGFGAAARAYKRLGIDLSQTTDQIFAQAVEEIGKLKNATDRGALATELFGDEAIRLGNTFKGGVAGLEVFAQTARDLGLILSDDLVRGAEKANDQLSIMKQVIDVQFTRVLVELAPTITRIGEAFAETAIKASAFIDAMNEIGDQSKSTLKNTVKVLQSQYSELQSELEDTLAKQSGEKGPDGLIELVFGLRDPSEIRAEMVKVEEEFKEAIERLNKLNRVQITSRVAGGGGGGGGGRALPTKLPTLRFPKQEEVKALKDPVDDFINSLYRYREELDLINPKLERLGELFVQGAIPVEVYTEGVKRLGFETESSLDGLADDVDVLEDSWKDLGLTFASAFEDAIIQGGNLSDILKGLEQDIIRIMTRKLVTERLGDALSGAFSSGGLFGNLFGGGGAPVSSIPLFGSGGNFFAGQPMIVGDGGPELMVPRQSGTVIPNNQLGGGTVNVYVNPPPGASVEAYRLSARQGALEGSRILGRSRAIS